MKESEPNSARERDVCYVAVVTYVSIALFGAVYVVGGVSNYYRKYPRADLRFILYSSRDCFYIIVGIAVVAFSVYRIWHHVNKFRKSAKP